MYQIVRSAESKASEPQMKVDTACRKLVESFSSRPTLRSGSLITTVFGDAIAPRGGNVWLGSLIKVMADFGISERLVRTSVFRLTRDDWLQSEQVGRRSYYSLTSDGRSRFEQATQRIYSVPVVSWNGRWCLLLLSGLNTAAKEVVRKELGWLGFGQLSANVLAHPSPDLAELDIAIKRIAVADELVVLEGQTIRNEPGMRELAHNGWNLTEINERYEQFVKMFRPVMKATSEAANIEEKQAFLVRTLLIQEYRKVLLRDPQLPQELLPPDWKGVAAYQLCRNLYLATHHEADRYLASTMETTDGPLPPPGAAFWKRFGGLGEKNHKRASDG
jgi:phenylacetic acid degradation operon negative regulatory protein